MAGRQFTRKNSILLKLVNLEKFREKSFLVKATKFDIEKIIGSGSKVTYANTNNLRPKNFAGQNYWNARYLSSAFSTELN